MSGTGKFEAKGRRRTKMNQWSRRLEKAILAAGLVGLQADAAPPDVTAQGSEASPAMAPVKQTSWWDQQYMFGDWGGRRSWLADQGVTFDFNNIGDFQANVSGRDAEHAAYFGRFRASTDVNFNKLSDFDGEFFTSGVWQYGPNLSGRYLHVNTLTSSIAGEDTERLDQFWYMQGLFNHQLTIKVGQVVAVNEFGATDFFDILFNDELGYAPNALFQSKQSFSPAGKPGAVVRGDLSIVTPGLYVKAGVFAAYDDAYHPDRYGFDYKDDFNHGVAASFEVGYEEPNKDYPGVYKVGVNANNEVPYTNPNTGEQYKGDFTAYGIAEKTVFHPTDAKGNLETKKGLDLLVEFLGAPGDRNDLEFEFTAGARYTGLIPGRDQDKTGFGLIYSKNGDAASDAFAATHGYGLNGETTLEVDYQFNPMSWFSLQADTQYIFDPGGDNQRSGITVVALRTIFRF